MAQAWCIEGSERCTVNTRKIHNATFLPIYPKYTKISKNICEAQGVANSNPINV